MKIDIITKEPRNKKGMQRLFKKAKREYLGAAGKKLKIHWPRLRAGQPV